MYLLNITQENGNQVQSFIPESELSLFVKSEVFKSYKVVLIAKINQYEKSLYSKQD